MISEVHMKIENGKVNGEIIIEGGHKQNDLYGFYLIKSADVIYKTGWITENNFSFYLNESGTYFLQGYFKRDGTSELMRSMPHEYISNSDYSEYKHFLEGQPIKTILNLRFALLIN